MNEDRKPEIMAPAAGGRRIKLLRCPSLLYNYSGIPPFGIATITAMLRQHGYPVDPDDLDAKCAGVLFPLHRWGQQFPARTLMQDIPRLRLHWAGTPDPEVDQLVDRVLGQTDLHEYDTVLLSCVEGDDVGAALALCLGQRLKRQGRLVVMGGEAYPHMQPIKDDFKWFSTQGCFDFYIQGYGELPLVELFRCLDNGRPVEDVPGLLSLDTGGEVRENAPVFLRPEVLPDFDGLPMSLYGKRVGATGNELVEDPAADKMLILPIKLNYCCPMRCAFCISSGRAFSKVTSMPPQVLVEGLRRLKDRHGTSCFIFYDDVFNHTLAFAHQVADALIEADLGILWSDCAHARHVDREVLGKLYRAGARRLVWGLESASPAMLKRVNKSLRVEELEQVLRWSHEAGIYNGIELIAGLPHETDEEIEMTVDFLLRNRPWIDQVFLNPFSLITGSLMHLHPEKYGIANVRKLGTLFDQTPGQTYSWIQRYTFDEIGGLAWPDKAKQIQRSYQRIHQVELELGMGGHDLYTIFLAYTRDGSKQNIQGFQSGRRHYSFDFFGDAGKAHNQSRQE
ncbi:MAG: radical SAM protein [Verrucomicrobia bacterium]|nr:radical SAM protein [Verrucomicrobiota bacterium]